MFIYLLQNIRIRKTKAYNLITDVYKHKFQVICLFQKWINISCINYNRFPITCLDYIAEKVSDVKSQEEGPFIPISDSISGFVPRPNFRYILRINTKFKYLKFILTILIIYYK
jgi:hypothetical protein